MPNRRVLMVASALALGATAAVATVVVVNRPKTTVAAPSTASVTVLVAAKDIPLGMTADSAVSGGFIRQEQVARSLAPATAVTNGVLLKGKVSESVIPTGEVIVNGLFIDAKVASSSQRGISIPPGEVAITITMDPSHAAAGLIVPGDHIDLMATFGSAKEAPGGANSYTHIFYQNALVLAVGQSTAVGATAPAGNASLYTLAVLPDAAERIVQASVSDAPLSAALVPANNKPAPVGAVPAGGVDSLGPTAILNNTTLTPDGK